MTQEHVIKAIEAETISDPQWPIHKWVAFRVTEDMDAFPKVVTISSGETLHLAGYVTFPGEDDVVTYEEEVVQ